MLRYVLILLSTWCLFATFLLLGILFIVCPIIVSTFIRFFSLICLHARIDVEEVGAVRVRTAPSSWPSSLLSSPSFTKNGGKALSGGNGCGYRLRYHFTRSWVKIGLL